MALSSASQILDLYLGQINSAYYPTPPPGLRIRIIVWGVLLGVGLCLSVVYLALLVYEARIKGRRLWLWRLSPCTAGGKLILGNGAMIVALTSVISFILLYAHLFMEYRVWYSRGSQAMIFYFRSYTLLVPFGLAWFAPFSSFQSLLATLDRTGNGISPTITNIIYVATTFGLLLGSIIVDWWAGSRGRELWRYYLRVVDAIDTAQLRVTTEGGLPPGTLTAIGSLIDDFSAAGDRCIQAQFQLVVWAIFLCSSLFVLNVTCATASYFLRRRVRDNSQIGALSLREQLTTVRWGDPGEIVQNKPSTPSSIELDVRLESADAPTFRLGSNDMLVTADESKDVQALRRASVDVNLTLLYASCTVTNVFGLAIWSCVYIRSVPQRPAYYGEIIALGMLYIMSFDNTIWLSLLILNSVLAIRTYRERESRRNRKVDGHIAMIPVEVQKSTAFEIDFPDTLNNECQSGLIKGLRASLALKIGNKIGDM